MEKWTCGLIHQVYDVIILLSITSDYMTFDFGIWFITVILTSPYSRDVYQSANFRHHMVLLSCSLLEVMDMLVRSHKYNLFSRCLWSDPDSSSILVPIFTCLCVTQKPSQFLDGPVKRWSRTSRALRDRFMCAQICYKWGNKKSPHQWKFYRAPSLISRRTVVARSTPWSISLNLRMIHRHFNKCAYRHKYPHEISNQRRSLHAYRSWERTPDGK